MSKDKKEVIERMKYDLLMQVDEWAGMYTPVQGTEDYDTWQLKLDTIDAIENIHDVIEYVECNFLDLNDFFLTGGYELLTAGLAPEKIPSSIVSGLGELIAERVLPNDAKCEIFFFDGKYFVIDGTKMQIAESEKEAFMIADIEEEPSDDIIDDQEPPIILPMTETPPLADLTTRNRRAVLIVAVDWPCGGTEMMKYGDSIRSALHVTKDKMTLLQKNPEFIFRVETDVSEAEFREGMKSRGFGSHYVVLFIEIPETRA
ncbi:MAG: hypothetical protein EOM45_13455 [Clostridia bacterium]|nr:hypothetical protein [Clostridia bacterium]